jgi:hypothetical protein
MVLPEKLVNSYKEPHQFPNQDIAPKDKGAKYIKSTLEAIFSAHVRGRSGIPYSKNYDELEDYGNATQSVSRYQDELVNKITDVNSNATIDTTLFNKEKKRRAYENINWEPVPILPHIKDHLHGRYDALDFDVLVDTIDSNSGAEKEEKKAEILVEILFKEQLRKVRQSANMEEPQQEQSYTPETIDEVEMYEAAGGFKPNNAMEMEKVIKDLFDLSEWREIKEKHIDDAIHYGIFGGKLDYDEDLRKYRVKRVDPKNAIVQYSEYNDFHDSEYAGEIIKTNINSLYQWGFKVDELEDIAKSCCGYFGNPDKKDFNKYSGTENGVLKFGFFTVCVFDGVWLDCDTKYQKKYKTSSGNIQIKNYNSEKEYERAVKDKNTKGELRRHRIKKVYKGKWIIGTDHVYDYGVYYNQLRPLPSKPVLPYYFIRVTNKSLTERLRPFIDNICLAWYKFQNAEALASQSGYAINLRLLQNVELGGKRIEVKDILRILREKGHLFYSDTSLGQGGKYEGGAVTPIAELPGGLGRVLEESIQKWEWALKRIEDVTGITRYALGQSPSGEQGKATSEMALAATSTSLRGMINGILRMKSGLAKKASLGIPVLLRTDKDAEREYAKVIGKKGVGILKLAESNNAAYGMTLEARPDEEQKQRILQIAQGALQPQRNGEPQIDYPDYLFIEERVMSGGNLKEVRRWLTYIIRKNKERQRRIAMENEKMNTQRALAIEQQKEQKELRIKQIDHEAELKKQDNEANNDMRVKNFEYNKEKLLNVDKYAHEEDMKEMELQNKE